jgi:large subunit ribosomal protein L25
MADKTKLTASKRTLTGRKVKQLRRKNLLPANVYGKGVKSASIEVPAKEFQTAFKSAGETSIIDLQIDKETKTRPVLVHNIQVDPVSDEILHVDFHQVDLTQKVTVTVPVEFVGEAPAVIQGGVLVKLFNEVEVEALPADLPDKLTVDVSGLDEIGKSIALKDLKIDTKKVKLLVENLDELVVKIDEPTKEEEVAPAAPVTEEVPAAEGAAPAEAKPEEQKPGVSKEAKKEEAKPSEAKK